MTQHPWPEPSAPPTVPTSPAPSYPPSVSGAPPWPPPGHPPPPPSYPPPAYFAPPRAYPPYAPVPFAYAPPSPPPRLLDEEVRAGLTRTGHWFWVGLAQYFLPVLAMVAVGLVIGVARLPRGPVMVEAYGALAGCLALGMVWLSGRGLAEQYGGWRRAFGFCLPQPRHAKTALGWLGIQIGARMGLLVVLGTVAPALQAHGGNTEGTSDLPAFGLLLAGVSAVVLAPVMEELAFRGIVLRGLMRRMPFWPAALLSSLMFASLHAPGAAHLAGIPLLVSMMLVFGLLQCVLVRRSGTLAPAIAVHGAMNLVVLVLAAGS